MLTGQVDVGNQYTGTVLVTAFLPGAGKNTKTEVECSGVLVSPQLVLTAGHCVCAQQLDENRKVISSSSCVASANVTAVVYESPGPEGALSSLHTVRRGRVRPHPELRVLLDDQGGVAASTADLAVIILNRPLDLPPVKLAEAEVEINEPIVIVGYGSDEDDTEERRFNKTRVIKLLNSNGGRMLLQPTGREGYTDDSGGPCLREAGRAYTLVGISSRGLGQEPTATSTYFYRTWLGDEIQHANGPASAP